MGLLSRFLKGLPAHREAEKRRAILEEMRGDLRYLRAMADDRAMRADPRYAEPRRLLRHEHRVNSQSGEDGIVREILRRIGTTNRVFAEVGCGDGAMNNTAFLLSQGWTGFWIDADDTFLRTISGRADLPAGCVKTLVSFVDAANVAPSFAKLGVPKEFDVLSLDVDQNTYYVWEALAGFKPRVVVVEYNAAIPADVEWKVNYDAARAWDRSRNFGAGLKALENLGRRLGYGLVGCTFNGANAFFVRSDLTGAHFAEPFTSENHYEPPRYAYGHPRGHGRTILDRPTSA
jgi:hypothetical protein